MDSKEALVSFGEHALVDTTIQPVWNLVRKIREQVGEALSAYPAEFRSGAMMTASELVENAVKYGESLHCMPDIRFSMAASHGKLVIRTVNGSSNAAGVHELTERIEEIRRSSDKGALYQARLERLLACSSEVGKLGLYRIAFEGRFRLEVQYENQVVTVIAERDWS